VVKVRLILAWAASDSFRRRTSEGKVFQKH